MEVHRKPVASHRSSSSVGNQSPPVGGVLHGSSRAGITIGRPHAIIERNEKSVVRIKDAVMDAAYRFGVFATSANRSCFGPHASSCENSRRVPQEHHAAAKTQVWSRAAFAEFLGVPDNPTLVADSLSAHASQLVQRACNEISQSSLPFLNQEAHGNLMTYASFASAQSFVACLGNLFFGPLADRLGARTAMLFTHASSLAYLAILSMSSSQRVLFLSLVPYFFARGASVAERLAYATALQPAASRRGPSPIPGRLNLASGCGFATVAVLLSVSGRHCRPRRLLVLAAGVELLYLCTILTDDDALCTDFACDWRADQHPASSSIGSGGFKHIWLTPNIPRALFLKFGLSSASTLVLSLAPQVAMNSFGMTPVQTGFLVVYVGLAQVASQAVLDKALDKFMGRLQEFSLEKRLIPIVTTLAGGAISLSLLSIVVPTSLCMSLSASFFAGEAMLGQSGVCNVVRLSSFLFWLGPLAATHHILDMTTRVDVTHRIQFQHVGLVSDVDSFIRSICGVTMPLLAAALMKTYGFVAVPLAGAFIATGTMSAVLFETSVLRLGDIDKPLETPEEPPHRKQAVLRALPGSFSVRDNSTYPSLVKEDLRYAYDLYHSRTPFVVSHDMGFENNANITKEDCLCFLQQSVSPEAKVWSLLYSPDGIFGNNDYSQFWHEHEDVTNLKLRWVWVGPGLPPVNPESLTPPRNKTPTGLNFFNLPDALLEFFEQASPRATFRYGSSKPFIYVRAYMPECTAAQLLKDSICERFAKVYPPLAVDYTSIFISSTGAQTNLHFDYHSGYVIMIAGRKRFVTFPPDATPSLCTKEFGTCLPGSRRSWFTDGLPSNWKEGTIPEFAGLGGKDVVIGPGKMIFIPAGVWHDVTTMDPFTISIIVRCKT